VTQKTWSDWFDAVLPECPGVSQEMATYHIKQAAIDFFRKSKAWVVDQGPMSVSGGSNTYDWEPPTETEVERPLKVWFNKSAITGKSRNWLSAKYGDFMQAEGIPEHYCQDTQDQIILVPGPNSTAPAALTAKIAVRPTQAAAGIDPVYFGRYFDAIASGAKARLMRMGKKPWSDPALSTFYQAEFDSAVDKALLESSRGLGEGGGLRVRAQFM